MSEEKGFVRGIDVFFGVYSYNVNFNLGILIVLVIFDIENFLNFLGKNFFN